MSAPEPPGPDRRDIAAMAETGSDGHAAGPAPTADAAAGSTGEAADRSSIETGSGGVSPGASHRSDDASPGDPGQPGEGPADLDVPLAVQLAAVADPWRRARMAAQAAEALRHELREVTEVLAEAVDALVGRHRDEGPPPADVPPGVVDAPSVPRPGATDGGSPVDEGSPAPSEGSACRLVELVDPFGVARTVVPWCVGGALHVPRLVVRRLTAR